MTISGENGHVVRRTIADMCTWEWSCMWPGIWSGTRPHMCLGTYAEVCSRCCSPFILSWINDAAHRSYCCGFSDWSTWSYVQHLHVLYYDVFDEDMSRPSGEYQPWFSRFFGLQRNGGARPPACPSTGHLGLAEGMPIARVWARRYSK